MTETTGIDLSQIKTRILDTPSVPLDQPWYIAYSGGLDSTVLLHLLWRISGDTGVRLVALHADHGLNPQSAHWRYHCENQCRKWGIDCRTTALAYPPDSGLGPEGRARESRYQWFVEQAEKQGWLFTAHHRGDQAETVIERLARGSGPRGLRAMLPVTHLYGLHVIRPMLDTPRQAIEDYAKRHNLVWVNDDSNQNPRYTRNYIRNQVLPVMTRRWPAVEPALARTAHLMAETQAILDQTAVQDLGQTDERTTRGDPSLDILALKTLTPERRRNLLRFWIHRESGISLAIERLNRLLGEIDHYPDKTGGLSWSPVDLRLYRGRLYQLRTCDTPGRTLPWNLESELAIGKSIVLTPRKVVGQGLHERAAKAGVTVRFRRGGEKCRLPGRKHRHTLKHILQDAGIPPWQRSRIPLIFIDDDVAAIAGVACCEPYSAGPNENGIEIEVLFSRATNS